MYADLEYYHDIYKGTNDNITDTDLKRASDHVDSLTYNRIKVDELTDYQLNIIKESTCMIADFELENKDIIDSAINSYSLNGASVDYSGIKSNVVNGIVIKDDVYQHLKKCGLCIRIL